MPVLQAFFILGVWGWWTNAPGSTKSQERFWTRAARPQGEGRDGPSQSHPLRHFIFESFLRLESLGLFPTAKFRGLWGTDHDQPRAICPWIHSGKCSTGIGNFGARGGSSFHRSFDRVNVGFSCPYAEQDIQARWLAGCSDIDDLRI